MDKKTMNRAMWMFLVIAVVVTFTVVSAYAANPIGTKSSSSSNMSNTSNVTSTSKMMAVIHVTPTVTPIIIKNLSTHPALKTTPVPSH